LDIKHTCKIPAKAGIDWFLALLIGAVLLAWMLPAIGATEGALSLSSFANYGISLIFFFYGLKLNSQKLNAGLSDWRLHILIHLTTFVLFPLLILLILPVFQGDNNTMLRLGLFYMAALPSTVSSSVVMVSIAKGNVPAAIFNASISSFIGIFITPLLVTVYSLQFTVFSYSIIQLFDYSIIGKLALQILLPVLVGMALNPRFGAFAEKHSRKLRMFDQSIILLIVYTSFCASFAHNVFEGFSWITIVGCAGGMLLMFCVVFAITGFMCSRLKMSREDTITAQFCGSKKSLVHGMAMSKVIFAGYSGVGVILLPIMLYHALQLMVVSAIAAKLGKRG
jgi:sodium/bile acid cotransporter 7